MQSRYKLYPYQEEGVQFMLKTKRVLVGDDMGLGKTLQSIAVADRIGAKKILVLCPKALIYGWQSEIKRFASNTKTTEITGTAAQKRKAWIKNVNWYITNHETLLQLDKYPQFMQQWDLIVSDEFHNYMNRKAKKTLALKKLKSAYFLGLTGTPILTKPDQLWSQLNIIAPKAFKSYWKWTDEYCKKKTNPFSQYTPIIDGVLNENQFKGMLAPYFIRRLKEDVLDDLPDKIINKIPLKLNKDQEKLYKQMKQDMIIECGEEFHKSGTVLEQIIRLRQICLDPRILPEVGVNKPGVKTEALLNIIESSDNQIVIFSSYKTYANLIASELKKRKISYELLTGDTKQAARVGQLKRFQEGKSRIFLGTIKAGGVGLNLQCASTLIFTDKDYSPAINEQAEARIHRIGQKNAAEIITLYTVGTVDELMEKMLVERGAMINGVITSTRLYEEMMK